MRTIQYVRAGCLIGTLGACMLMAGLARADVSTERPGSILIFPKVTNADGRNTIIQITNTGNSIDTLHCFYLDARTGPNGHPLCASTDFIISLTRQQPTHWVVGDGRPVNPSDSITGFDPGIVPPVSSGFVGALVCAEVGDDDVPVAMNKIKGEATLEGVGGDVSKYNGIAVQGKTSPGANNGDNTLSLNNVEYNACSTGATFNFIPDGSTDPVIAALGNGGTCTGGDRAGLGCNTGADCPGTGGGTCTPGASRVFSTITALPCNLDLQTQVPTAFQLNYLAIDEDETATSASSGPLECWASIDLASISQALANPAGPLLGPFATLRISAGTGGPVFLVGETFHVDADGNVAAAAVNIHTFGLCRASTSPTSGTDIHQVCQCSSGSAPDSNGNCASTDCGSGILCHATQSSAITLPSLLP